MTRRPPVIEVVDDDMADVLRRKTGAERLKIVDVLYGLAWNVTEANVRSSHPDWSDTEVLRAVAVRIAGEAD